MGKGKDSIVANYSDYYYRDNNWKIII